MITYRVINKTSGRFYIGSTKDLKRRMREHRNSKASSQFQMEYKKNPKNFEWEVYEDESDGRELEQALLEMYAGTELCYNSARSSGGGAVVGARWWRKLDETEESHGFYCPGEGWVPGRLRSSLVSAQNANLGRTVNPELRKKLSRKLKGRKRTEDTKEKMRSSWKGKRWWTNPEGGCCRAVEKPGEDWVQGRVYRDPKGV